MLGFIIHANTYEYFHPSDFGYFFVRVSHIFDGVDEPIFLLEFAKGLRFHRIPIIAFGAVVSSNWFLVLEQRNFKVIDPLVEDPGATVQVQGGIDWLCDLLGHHLHFYHCLIIKSLC